MKKFVAYITVDGTEYTIDNLNSLNVSRLDRGNTNDTIDWGLYSNRGSISFFPKGDTNSNFWRNVFESFLSKNIDVVVKLSIDGTEHQICKLICEDLNYNYETREVTIELRDFLIDLQEKPYKGYREYSGSGISLSSILEEIREYDFSVSVISTFLHNIHTPVVDIQKTNKYSVLQDLVQAGMARGFVGSNGTLVIHPDLIGFTAANENFPYLIQPKDILDAEDVGTLSKNAILNAKATFINRTAMIDKKIADADFDWWVEEPDPLDENKVSFPWSGKGDLESEIYRGGRNDETGSYIFVRTSGNIDVPDTTTSINENYLDVVMTMQRGGASDTNVPITPDSKKISYIKKDQKVSVVFTFKNAAGYQQDGFQTIVFYYLHGTASIKGTYYTQGEDVEKSFQTAPNVPYAEIQTNDFMQNGNKINGKSYPSTMMNAIQEKFSKGFDCCTIECLFSDYYNTNGTKLDGIFEQNMIVCPYVRRNKLRLPYKIDNDGYPKTFRIIGIEYLYDGHPRQKLHLQEYGIIKEYEHKFYINTGSPIDTEYGFYDNMTWRQFVNHKVGKSFYIQSEKVFCVIGTYIYEVTDVSPNSKIYYNYTYSTEERGNVN